MNNEEKRHKITVELDPKLFKKIADLSKTKHASKSAICRQIMKDYFLLNRQASVEAIADKLEQFFPDMETYQREYSEMKTQLSETIKLIHDSHSLIREMKKGDYLTYKTIDNQRKEFEKFKKALLDA